MKHLPGAGAEIYKKRLPAVSDHEKIFVRLFPNEPIRETTPTDAHAMRATLEGLLDKTWHILRDMRISRGGSW